MANRDEMSTLYLNDYLNIFTRACKSEGLAGYHIPIMNPGPNLGAAVREVDWNSSAHTLSQGVLKFKQRLDHLWLFPPPTCSERSDSGFSLSREEKSIPGTMEFIASQYEARSKRMIPEVPLHDPPLQSISFSYTTT